MWEVPRELPKLYREFNGIDFGHAHLGETLLKTQDDAKVEHARVEVLDFIFSAPRVPPDEEQIAPTLVRTFWEVQRTFHWTHVFHRSLYDLFAADEVADKEAAYHKILGDYLSKPEAIAFHTLDHHGKLWGWPESKAFRDKFRKFNSQIWAYHWLQGATYDVQLMGGAAKQRELHASCALQFQSGDAFAAGVRSEGHSQSAHRRSLARRRWRDQGTHHQVLWQRQPALESGLRVHQRPRAESNKIICRRAAVEGVSRDPSASTVLVRRTKI